MPNTVNEDFSSQSNSKADLISVIHLMLAIVLFILGNYLSQRAQIYLSETFDPVWVFIMRGYVTPLLYIGGGWLFINGFNKFFFFYPFTVKNSKKQKIVSKSLLIILIIFLAVCFLNVLPYTVKCCMSSFFNIDVLSAFPRSSFLLGEVGVKLFQSLHQEKSFIFIFGGILLWYFSLHNSKETNKGNISS